MFRSLVIIIGLTALAPSLSLGQQVGDPTDYELVPLEAAELMNSIREGRIFVIPLEDRPLLLELDPVDLQHEGLLITSDRGVLPLEEELTFEGREVGQPETVARLSVVEDGVRGYVRQPSGWVFIQPAPESERTIGDEHRVHSDAEIDPKFLGACAAHLVESPHAHSHAVLDHDHTAAAEPPISEDQTFQELQIAVDCDNAFYLLHGAGTSAQVQAVLNEVDGIFRTELGLALVVSSINVWTDMPDPYTSTDAGTLLGQMRTHWNASFTGVERDLAHLFTGKDLDGSTIGVGYVGVLCSQTFGYALSQELNSAALMPILVAHEIGHNLGSGHDASPGSPQYIMYPSLSASNLDEFSSDSKASIQVEVDGSSCLSTLTVADPPAGGGGGGGGPVDPLALLVIGAAGCLIARRSRRL